MIKKYIKKRPKTNHFRHPRLNIIPEFIKRSVKPTGLF